MSLLMLLFIGAGLSMDAFAVSVSDGLCCTGLRKPQAFCTALSFGVFQGMMPVLGFFLGRAFAQYICTYDHWIALFLLGFIGVKMLLDAFRQEETDAGTPFTARLLLMQSTATSIDALAVGVSMAAMQDVNILTAAFLICAVTFAVSLTGIRFGRYLGEQFGSRAQIAGGLLLIGIGVKIFAEHVFEV